MAKEPSPSNYKLRKDYYIARLLYESPKETIKGIPVIIEDGGEVVRTLSSGKVLGLYLPWSYPDIFGWERPERKR